MILIIMIIMIMMIFLIKISKIFSRIRIFCKYINTIIIFDFIFVFNSKLIIIFSFDIYKDNY